MKKTNTIHFGIQRKIVSNMTTESWETIPHVTYMYEPDVTKLMHEYKKLNLDRNRDSKITLNTVIMKIITEGLKVAPVMNSHIEFNRKLVRGRVDTFEDINISMPMILPSGEMMTVNLRGFESKNLDEMTDAVNDVARRAENTDLNEAMFDVSLDNTLTALKKGKFMQAVYRLIGSLYREQSGAAALLEIIPPQVTAFGVGAVQDKPMVITDSFGNKSIEARKVLPICIAFDHRALDFGDIVPFLKRLDDIFENPKVIHTWKSSEKNNKVARLDA